MILCCVWRSINTRKIRYQKIRQYFLSMILPCRKTSFTCFSPSSLFAKWYPNWWIYWVFPTSDVDGCLLVGKSIMILAGDWRLWFEIEWFWFWLTSHFKRGYTSYISLYIPKIMKHQNLYIWFIDWLSYRWIGRAVLSHIFNW